MAQTLTQVLNPCLTLSLLLSSFELLRQFSYFLVLFILGAVLYYAITLNVQSLKDHAFL